MLSVVGRPKSGHQAPGNFDLPPRYELPARAGTESIPLDQDLLDRLGGLVLGRSTSLPLTKVAPAPSTGTDGRMGSLQARKHFSDLDRPKCGPSRGP